MKNPSSTPLSRLLTFMLVGFLALSSSIQAQQTAPLDPQNAALLDFKREQIALIQGEIARLAPFAPPSYRRSLDALRERATLVERLRGDAALVPAANFHERAYRADNDGSAQPFWVAIPDGYTPDKKWPLIVFLHGYSTAISKVNPWIPSLNVVRGAQNRGFLFAIPYGRRNSDFVQWGEDDVLRVKTEVSRLYAVDETRTFLLGASMGGYGAHAVGLHTAGQWAGVAPVSAQADMYRWFDLKREDVPAWQRVLYDANNPRTLAPNAQNVPWLLQHGALDTVVPVDHSRLFAADARVLNLPFTYYEDPEGGHFDAFQVASFDRAFDWFGTLKPLPTPRRIALVTGDLRENRAHWARIEAFENYSELARLDAFVDEAVVQVTTKNVARFVLDLPRDLVKGAAKIALEVNGEKVGEFETNAPLPWKSANAKVGKTPARVGPFKNLMRDPFLLVYGDNTDEKAARRFVDEWKAFADGDARLKSAKDVTDADKANFNLILFGTRASNPLISFVDEWPLELVTGGVRVGNRTVAGADLGLRMVWRSPWSEKRLVGVCSGRWWGEELAPNHKWDLMPDFIVYGAGETEGADRILDAGWFDGNWIAPENEKVVP